MQTLTQPADRPDTPVQALVPDAPFGDFLTAAERAEYEQWLAALDADNRRDLAAMTATDQFDVAYSFRGPDRADSYEELHAAAEEYPL